ncbi:MAG: hydrogen peroxide-inducible genes activator [Mangrovibacterium sp.]
MITLTQLEYIVAVDTYRHFGKAAQACFITQPTLSMQIKKLEEDLEVIIFDRSRQPLIPTKIGVKILEQARIVLQQKEVVNEIIREHKSQVEGTLKIGVIPTLAPYIIPMFVGDFKRTYPDISIKIEELTTQEIITRLGKELIDVGILVTPLHNDKFDEKPLFYEKMMIYCNKQHPLHEAKDLKVEDVTVPDLWLLSDGHCFRNQVINLCSESTRRNKALPFSFEAGSLETLMNIIDKEGGITLIPELATLEINEARSSQVKEFSDVTPVREVSLIYSKHYAKMSQIKRLAKAIVDVVPEKMRDKNRGTLVSIY